MDILRISISLPSETDQQCARLDPVEQTLHLHLVAAPTTWHPLQQHGHHTWQAWDILPSIIVPTHAQWPHPPDAGCPQ